MNTTTQESSIMEYDTQEIIKKPAKTLNPNPYNLVFIDDNLMIRKMLKQLYQKSSDYAVKTFSCGEAFFEDSSVHPDIIVLDFHLSDDGSLMNGLAILSKIKEVMPETKVIMLSSQGEVNTAVSCLKKGATDYVVKDDVMNLNVKKSVEQIVKSMELKLEIQSLSQTIKRDKLLIKGYGVVIFALVLLATFLYLR